MPRSTVTFCVRTQKIELRDRSDVLASEMDRSRNWVLVEAIRLGLAELERRRDRDLASAAK